jgi:hypothetical protein
MALSANPLDSLLSDLRTISNESKRKFPPLREAAEAAILKVRTLTSKNHQNIDVKQAIRDESVRILEPFIMGCEFKQNQKVVQISLNAIQRMITHQAVSSVAACKLVDCLWTLIENNLEEVKVLQTATLLLSTNNVVSGPVLARTIVLCFRLYNINNNVVTSIASATIRQLVSNVFERVENEDNAEFDGQQVDDSSDFEPDDTNNLSISRAGRNETVASKIPVDYAELKSFISGHLVNLANALRQMQYAPRSLKPAAADAFLLLRDLILILNDEQPLWLVGLTDSNKTFVLELLELVFISFSDVLARHEEFRFLIKERVCYMILEMFSPDINYSTANEYDHSIDKAVDHAPQHKGNMSESRLTKGGIISEEFTSVVSDIKFSMENNRSISSTSMRILRILSMLIQKFYVELLTSGDIFTAIFTKLLENDSNLKQVSGPIKLARLSSADTGTAGTTISSISTSDIPVVSTMISKLFENSHLLRRKHLMKVVDDLCKLNTSPYVMTKLLELALMNLHRIGCIWERLTSHFFEISKNQNLEVRDWGACALTHLIKSTCSYEDSQSATRRVDEHDDDLTEEDAKLLEIDPKRLLFPLQCLSQIQQPDIRQKQLDVVLQVIQSASNDSTPGGWPQIIDIVGTVDEWQTENLIRVAFQCLQGIVSDYMSQLDCECIILIIAAIVKFASQLHDLNVSLTAIGLLWNVADHLHQNKSRIELEKIELSHESNTPNLAFIYEYFKQSDLSLYDSIWMALFSKLSEICIDPRPAIRKSACQTLFATITTHGDLLELRTWQAIPWQILFPLLHQVRTRSCVAIDMKFQTPTSGSLYADSLGGEEDSLNSGCESLVLHHSRNTAQKQWSETQVIALSGVTKVFTSKRDKLASIHNFNRAWNVLLEFIKTAALSKVFEISLAALKCFQDLLSIESPENSYRHSSKPSINNLGQEDESSKSKRKLDVNLWLSIWVVPIINLLPLCDESMSAELREDFARCCFEALLQFSNFSKAGATATADEQQQVETNNNDADIVNKLAVDCLLNRFMDVVVRYNHDERLAGKCPLPRHRMSEIVFVLRAMTTLLRSLKKVPTSVVGPRVWEQVLSLYPHLVDFATRNSPADQVKREALNEVLMEYGSLLKPPSPVPLD